MFRLMDEEISIILSSNVFCGSFVFLMLRRLFIAALWSPAGKGLTSCLLLVIFIVFLLFSMWYPGSGVVLDCIVS